MKVHTKGEYKPYREIPAKFLDPKDEFPEIKTQTKNTIPEEEIEVDIPKISEPEWNKMTEKVRSKIFR